MINVTETVVSIIELAIMKNEFWNKRYETNDTVYGDEPNAYFKSFIDSHKPGSILLPADGEGRNAIYAAQKGWQVDAFDFSKVAQEKALQRAAEKKVKINYTVLEIEGYKACKQYDAVGLIFVHLEPVLRKKFHTEIAKSLPAAGYLIFEAFAKEQKNRTSGGPKEEALLYDAPSICSDFQNLHILSCGQKEVDLQEGEFHKGRAHVLRLIGQKI
ncbi:MAG: class I SAM-dependent methyltransferase [Chitinophagaceae bacterium]